jgi:ankyrin repeat protein
LILAVRRGQTKAVRELLAHGADPNVADGHGTTPLHAATVAGNSSIIVVLKQAGAR